MIDLQEILEPHTVEEASAWLGRYAGEAAFYAGGTELMIVLKEGLARYPRLINLKTIPGLDHLRLEASGAGLEIGPLVTHRQLERSELVREHAPLLAEVESNIANVRVRAAGTLGGNLCFAEPHSDPATLLLAWEATVELASENERRTLPIADFLLGMFETARRPEEVLSGIRLPLLPPGTVGAYEKFAIHERPTATAAAFVRLQDGAIAGARLSLGCVGPSPVRAAEAEALLMGAGPSEAVIQAAAARAAEAVDPADDQYGSAEYKRHLAGVLAARALKRALGRAAAEAQHGN